MKARHHILRVLILLAVYCYGIYVPATAMPAAFTQSVAETNTPKESVTTTSKILYAHTQQLDNVYSDFSEYSLSQFKLAQEGFWAISHTYNLLFHAKYKQYQNHLKTILIRHRKSDLIFPFHNFW
ncbi:hypothetical protein ACFFU1_15580 [Algibacter miyuki]|uniref:Uncharacterized protein n=1 Tax=Algibacter miyuki TaxID=1306933 RepID=A0ABV5H345_9FLAO|nr:hypothetical protein [Algibacter miyuki]MDN3665394.1 hypothetical protein [Algibacter miyuki]